jgi:hypothetical protein
MGRTLVHTGEMRNAYKILVTKPVGRDHLEDLGIDIKMDLKGTREFTDWIHLTWCIDQWYAFVNLVMNFLFLAGNFLSNCVAVGVSRSLFCLV